ncbi:MAG: hypothetical protein IKB79_01015 [Oscillospiraceae bacterium]|nr:hypothetical protein [Oscillospiraceae bacterium]
MKKRIPIIIAIVFVISLSLFFLMTQLLFKVFENPVIASLPKYDRSECYYGEGFQDYTDYCKFYFPEDSNIVETLKENNYFRPATARDVEEVKSYFNNFEGWVKYEEYKDKYDFEADCIDTSDYFYIENKDTCEKYADYPDKYAAYNVYFLDTQTKTLFFIHSNI